MQFRLYNHGPVADRLIQRIHLVPRNCSLPCCEHSNIALGHLKRKTANTLPPEIIISSYKFRVSGTVDIKRFIILVWVISWTVESTLSFLCVSKIHIWRKEWLCHYLNLSLFKTSPMQVTKMKLHTPKTMEILWHDCVSTWGSVHLFLELDSWIHTRFPISF